MNTEHLGQEDLEQAVALLKEGKLVAFETETVYGLGADATNEEAVEEIYSVKNRSKDKPLIVLISDRSQLEDLVESIPDKAQDLMDAYWPGPLTIVLKAKKGVLPDNVRGGKNTIGIRYTSSKVAQDLVSLLGRPIAAPSANRSGHISPMTADHVFADLDGQIAAVVDTGQAEGGVESTIIDLSTSRSMILRPGGISQEEIVRVIGPVAINRDLISKMKEEGDPRPRYDFATPVTMVGLYGIGWQAAIDQLLEDGESVGILANDQVIGRYGDQVTASFSTGAQDDMQAAAASLFMGLHHLDETEVTHILAEAIPLSGVGEAYMNRLSKAAEGRMI